MDTNTANPISLYLFLSSCAKCDESDEPTVIVQCPRARVSRVTTKLCVFAISHHHSTVYTEHTCTHHCFPHTNSLCRFAARDGFATLAFVWIRVCVTRTIYANLLAFEYFIHLKETDSHTTTEWIDNDGDVPIVTCTTCTLAHSLLVEIDLEIVTHNVIPLLCVRVRVSRKCKRQWFQTERPEEEEEVEEQRKTKPTNTRKTCSDIDKLNEDNVSVITDDVVCIVRVVYRALYKVIEQTWNHPIANLILHNDKSVEPVHGHMDTPYSNNSSIFSGDGQRMFVIYLAFVSYKMKF